MEGTHLELHVYASEPVCLLHQMCSRVDVRLAYIYVKEFAKRGLIHSSNISTLRMCNSASVGPTA